MSDFLLELRSEEIPARMQERAREDLARLFAAEIGRAGVSAAEVVTYATPRRLALIARGLPDATQAVREEVKGPRSSAPPQALEGFLRKTGLAREQLVERDGVLFAVTEREGRATADVLAAAILAIIRAFPWPKSMRWGASSRSTESLRWVRPLQGIVALLGDAVVPCEIAGVASGAATVGHRFHHPGIITIGSATDYVEKLRACHVIVDGAERRNIIAVGAKLAAQGAGLRLVEDEGLLFENAGLTEWPVPLLGRFDDSFLSVPPEVIQLTARVNQKYFVCRDADGRLAPAFVCTANVDAEDGGERIVEGNRKVLAARLSDAKFFYDTDRKTPLEALTPKLDKIVFHEKLGTVADKVERVAKLARWLVETGVVGGAGSAGARPDTIPVRAEPVEAPGHALRQAQGERIAGDASSNAAPATHVQLPLDPAASPLDAGEIAAQAATADAPDRAALADMAERAARLAKADLVTGMVGEFPELQGVMGGYYARAQGEPDAVADAVRDHYKPVGQGDDVPTAPVTVAVSLADKLDTLFAFFSVAEMPSGSRDPFALRRAALGVIRILTDNGLRLRMHSLMQEAVIGLLGPRLVDKELPDMRRDLEAMARHLPALGNSDAEQVAERYSQSESVQKAIDDADRNLGLIVPFFADRLKVQQREAGVRHDLIDAVFALGGEDDLVRLLARVRALQNFVATEDGANLLAGYKRAANILKKEGVGSEHAIMSSDAEQGIPQTGEEDPIVVIEDADLAHSVAEGVREEERTYAPEPAEVALATALGMARPRADAAIEAEDFEGAMAALASLRAPIDAFFEGVTVNDPDPVKRIARLSLLNRVREAIHRVADFSKIEG